MSSGFSADSLEQKGMLKVLTKEIEIEMKFFTEIVSVVSATLQCNTSHLTLSSSHYLFHSG
jgi:hypothetical protein